MAPLNDNLSQYEPILPGGNKPRTSSHQMAGLGGDRSPCRALPYKLPNGVPRTAFGYKAGILATNSGTNQNGDL